MEPQPQSTSTPQQHNNQKMKKNNVKNQSFLSSLIEAAPFRSPSFRQEDTYLISQLTTSQRRSLKDLKDKLLTVLDNPESATWNKIPLLDSRIDGGDVVLLKFLRARDFRVQDALTMLLKSLQWRKDFRTDVVLEEDLEFKYLENVVAYMHRCDRFGHPVCYNAYGVFKDPEMYERVFGDDEKLNNFLRWRVQVLERGIKLLDFKPGGVNSIIQVTDLHDMPKTQLREASKRILSLFQDNYPEFVAKKIFINVPWYFSLLYSMFSPFLTNRTKTKFVISREGTTAETLYRFISPENIPVKYGGLSRPDDIIDGGGPPLPASEFAIKGGEKVNIQIEGIEAGATIQWDIVVGGWDLIYSAEFSPVAEDGYTIAVEKPRWIGEKEEAIRNSYTTKEAGKLMLSVDNTDSRRIKVAAYRYAVRRAPAVH